MHPSALINAKHFFDCYAPCLGRTGRQIDLVEIGSQDVNGSLREVCPPEYRYLGVDFVEGQGVDLVLTDPYVLPLENASADVIVSSSCFEHSEMFWVLFLEIMRVLKPGGLLYLNVPSNGEVHRWPVDCWRFYPDSGRALVTWAQRNGVSAALLESFVSHQHPDGPTPGNAREYADDEFQWNDFIGVFLRDESHVPSYTQRMVDTRTDFTNGLKYGQEGFIHPARRSEDQTQLARVREERPSLLKALGIR